MNIHNYWSAVLDQNAEAQRFYRALPTALIRDEGIWIDL